MLSQNGETKESIKKLDKVSRLSLEIRVGIHFNWFILVRTYK